VSISDVIRVARAAGAKLIADGPALVLEAKNPPPQQLFEMLRAHKSEILEALRAERRAVVRYVNDHFQSSPLDHCAHCGGDRRAGDPFVAILVGEDSADVHASCHPAWIAEQEAKARIALGIDTPIAVNAKRDAPNVFARAKPYSHLGRPAVDLIDSASEGEGNDYGIEKEGRRNRGYPGEPGESGGRN
jgi:hypothetical protein